MTRSPFSRGDLDDAAKNFMHNTYYAFVDVWHELQGLPDSREKSLAITRLEEASMWANKAASLMKFPEELLEKAAR